MRRTQSVLCLALAGVAWVAGAAPANASAPAPAAASVLELNNVYPNLTMTIRFIGSNQDLAGYLGNPNSVCTLFVPTDAAITTSLSSLGKYGGLITQNATLQNSILNYHVIPDKAFTASDLMKLNDTVERSGETLYIDHEGGRPLLYGRPEYPVALNQTNIRAGKCIVHIIEMVLTPPSAIPIIQTWLDELHSWPPTPPRQDWAPIRNPQQAELVKATEARLAGTSATNSNASAPASIEGSPNTDTRAPATSTAGLVNVKLWQGGWPSLYTWLMGVAVLAGYLF